MSRLQELPPELLANIARFAGGRYRKGEREYFTGVAVCGFHTWRVRNAAGVAGRSGSVASDRGNAWLVRALLGGKFARHRGSQNLYYLSHPAP